MNPPAVQPITDREPLEYAAWPIGRALRPEPAPPSRAGRLTAGRAHDPGPGVRPRSRGTSRRSSTRKRVGPAPTRCPGHAGSSAAGSEPAPILGSRPRRARRRGPRLPPLRSLGGRRCAARRPLPRQRSRRPFVIGRRTGVPAAPAIGGAARPASRPEPRTFLRTHPPAGNRGPRRDPAPAGQGTGRLPARARRRSIPWSIKGPARLGERTSRDQVILVRIGRDRSLGRSRCDPDQRTPVPLAAVAQQPCPPAAGPCPEDDRGRSSAEPSPPVRRGRPGLWWSSH